MPSLRIALVQQASGLDPGQNRDRLGAAIESLVGEQADRQLDLVVFPEVFARDFGKPGSDISAYAEDMDGPFVRALGELAAKHELAVVAGMFERSGDAGRPFNTLAVVGPAGLRAKYQKIHLYDSFGYKESERLLAGDVEPVLVDVGDLRVGLMTCYDLRFPELARELVSRGADLLVVPAAWVAGDRKADHWRTLAKARAIENTVYVAAVGQPGPRYTGHSVVVDPLGDVLAEAGTDEAMLTAVVDREVVDRARATNPSLANRRF